MNVRTGKEGGFKKGEKVYISDLRGGVLNDIFWEGGDRFKMCVFEYLFQRYPAVDQTFTRFFFACLR